MTCVSERSGNASSAMFEMDQMPAKIAALVRTRTMKRLRAENAMIRSIRAGYVNGSGSRGRRSRGRWRRGDHSFERGLEPRLGVDQEVGLSHDGLAGGEAGAHLDVTADLRAGLDLARLEAAVALRDEDDGA